MTTHNLLEVSSFILVLFNLILFVQLCAVVLSTLVHFEYDYDCLLEKCCCKERSHKMPLCQKCDARGKTSYCKGIYGKVYVSLEVELLENASVVL